MKRMLALAAAALFASTTALAFHCPKDMKEIDDALAKKPKLTEAQMKEVKALRTTACIAVSMTPGARLATSTLGASRAMTRVAMSSPAFAAQ